MKDGFQIFKQDAKNTKRLDPLSAAVSLYVPFYFSVKKISDLFSILLLGHSLHHGINRPLHFVYCRLLIVVVFAYCIFCWSEVVISVA